jgi:alkyl hydroperoxide reductase subunit AhpC
MIVCGLYFLGTWNEMESVSVGGDEMAVGWRRRVEDAEGTMLMNGSDENEALTKLVDVAHPTHETTHRGRDTHIINGESACGVFTGYGTEEGR